jgi:hypothetical protein
MKVYETTNRKAIRKIPEIKIKNKKLIDSGFLIGKEFTVNYQKNKIILEIIQNKTIRQ